MWYYRTDFRYCFIPVNLSWSLIHWPIEDGKKIDKMFSSQVLTLMADIFFIRLPSDEWEGTDEIHFSQSVIRRREATSPKLSQHRNCSMFHMVSLYYNQTTLVQMVVLCTNKPLPEPISHAVSCDAYTPFADGPFGPFWPISARTIMLALWQSYDCLSVKHKQPSRLGFRAFVSHELLSN